MLPEGSYLWLNNQVMLHVSKCLILAHSIPYSDFNRETEGQVQNLALNLWSALNPLQNLASASGIFAM